ncbi:Pancreatic hormone [Echinococcus multilocularis]|uniref:Pancreatic hormone n=1 Tax=Echinococcus multilocularis TaxID=6211 RepID=A0A068Y9V0_ECHMU|nr:Pancreatic hormone [Echinococcus multilocularis]
MSLMTISSLLTTTLCLGLFQVSSAYRHSTSQFQDRFIPREEENFWPYWMDDPDTDGEEVVSDKMNKKSHPTVPLLPQYLERLKKFQSLKDKEKYVAALNSYYMIFGRPRFG